MVATPAELDAVAMAPVAIPLAATAPKTINADEDIEATHRGLL